jgi:hypothetical protein
MGFSVMGIHINLKSALVSFGSKILKLYSFDQWEILNYSISTTLWNLGVK